jgi:hypothetical protein
MSTEQYRSFWLSGKGLTVIALIALAGYFLLIKHGQHLAAWLPLLVVLLCPLFMHRGHGHDGGRNEHKDHTHNKDKN